MLVPLNRAIRFDRRGHFASHVLLPQRRKFGIIFVSKIVLIMFIRLKPPGAMLAAVTSDLNLWPNGEIPYLVDSELSALASLTIIAAIIIIFDLSSQRDCNCT